jgi:hypothetical protein
MVKRSKWAGGGRARERRGSARRWRLATLGAALALAALVASAAASSSPTVESLNHKLGTSLGGQKLVIKGMSLSGATAVRFGSGEASFTVASATRINAVSPPGEGTVAITVTTPGGTSALTAADEYKYESRDPGVSKVSTNKGPAAGGVTVKITGVNFKEVSAVEFGDVPAAEYTVESSTSITAVSPAQSVGLDDIRVTTPYGKSATMFCGPKGGKNQCSIGDHYKVLEPTLTGISPASGSTKGGTPITITGTGFELGSSGTAIKFAKGLASDVDCTSSTECTALAPSGKAGTLDVRLTLSGAGGVSATTAKNPGDRFTFSS